MKLEFKGTFDEEKDTYFTGKMRYIGWKDEDYPLRNEGYMMGVPIEEEFDLRKAVINGITFVFQESKETAKQAREYHELL